MSQTHNQLGSQTSQLSKIREQLELDRKRERDGDVATTTTAASGSQAEMVGNMPVILLAAQQPQELRESPRDALPSSSHQTTGTTTDQRIWRQGVGFDSKRNTTRDSSASTYNYDHEEPLTTKTTKIYKKRPSIKNQAADDSDDSLAIRDASAVSRRSQDASGSNVDTEFPLSDDTDVVKFSDATSSKLTSIESILIRDNNLDDLNPSDFQQGNLASGLGFIYMAIPPDGGYGWVVLVLSFLAQLIVDGIVFTVGILLPKISEEFHVNSGQVVLVGSIQVGCYFLGGAFSSALINSYGFRPVALLGVIISALSILAASFSPNLAAVIFFYSVIGGPGLSMIWVSSQIIIGYYFERYRPIASGFSCSGAGAGICIFSITNNILVQHIGWRNTIRFQVMLICLLFFVALAYSEVAPTPVAVMHSDPLSTSSSNEYYGNFYVHYFLGDEVGSRKSRHVLNSYEPPRKKKSKLRRCAKFCCPCCMKPDAKHEPSERSELNYVVRPDPIQRDDLFYTGPADYEKPHSREQFDGKQLELVGSESHLQRAAYGLHNIKDYDNTNASKPASVQSPLSPPAHEPTVETVEEVTERKKNWLRTKIVRALNRLFDANLLKNFEFRILLASAFLYPMGFNIPFVYSKMRTTIPMQYAQMISPAIGASNFLIRNLCGFVAYKLRGWTNYICGGGMMLGGVMVFISAFYGNDLVSFQFVYAVCFGVAPAVFATLRALIYVRYLGLSKLTNAFGITALAMGLGVFIGTTLGGILVDRTGGYVVPFAFAGICIMFSGALKLILPVLLKCRKTNKYN
ncbi:GH23835 [Drosophila grimshawi]|uniref:GH23835 n=1 Tax=Drosophila grimshawi TaxID=7222 RepID=B4K1F2_DROGR|nr:GH23835 [Drosophila grimshawi]